MELGQYLQIVWKWLWLIVLGTLLAAGVGYGVSSALPPTYSASTSLIVSAQGALGSDYSAIIASEHLAATYIEILTSRSVLEKVASDLGLDPQKTEELLAKKEGLSASLAGKKVEAQLIPNTSVVKLTVQDSDPRLAMEIANRIVMVFRETGIAARGRDLVVVESATQPPQPSAPNKPFITLVAAMGGLTLAAGTAFLIEYLDDTLETAEDVYQSLSLSALAVIPRPKGRQKRSKTPIAVAYPGSSLAEAYRTLRTRIQFSRTDGPFRTLLITSPFSREERANVVANLGVVMARAGLKVLLVDADLRQPQLHRLFGLDGELGLGTLLSGDGDFQECVAETDIPNLRLLSSGSPPPDPSELLGSQQMVRLIEEFEAQADFVLFNTPPVLAVADAMVLASRVDGTMLVVESRSTRLEAAMQAMEALRSVEAKVLGIVLNKVRAKRDRYRRGKHAS